MSDKKGTFETFTEEMTVAGGELIDTLQDLLKDASVHRLQVVNNKTGKVVVDIPAALSIPAVFLLNIWLVLGALILYVADFNIVVERRKDVGGEDSAETDESVAEKIIVHEEAAEKAQEAVKEAAANVAAATGVEIEQCQGKTKSGSQCKRKPMEGSAYCYAHQPE